MRIKTNSFFVKKIPCILTKYKAKYTLNIYTRYSVKYLATAEITAGRTHQNLEKQLHQRKKDIDKALISNSSNNSFDSDLG